MASKKTKPKRPYNAEANIQKLLDEIHTKRTQLRKVPMNNSYREKKAEIAKKISSLRQELWALEAGMKPKKK